MRARLAWVIASILGCTAVPAHAQVDDGVRAYEQADFRGALEAFDRALGGELSSEELSRLYLVRAQVRFALGDSAEMMRDAARLAAIDPERALDRAVPPQVRDAFAQAVELGAGLVLSAHAEPLPGGARVVAEVGGDPGDVVQRLHLAARPVGTGAWVEGGEGSLEVRAPGAIEWYAEVIGAGGAVLRSEGSAAAPRVLGEVATDVPVAPAAVPEADGAIPLWVIVGGGVVGAVLITAAIVLIASSGESRVDTQLSSPMFAEP